MDVVCNKNPSLQLSRTSVRLHAFPKQLGHLCAGAKTWALTVDNKVDNAGEEDEADEELQKALQVRALSAVTQLEAYLTA